MKLQFQKHWFLKLLGIGAVLVFIFVGAMTLFFRPSHDRQWEFGQEVLPQILIHGSNITVTNFRNFKWSDDGSAEPRYETRVFNKDLLDSVDVFISHFDEFEGLAHIFLSFGFETGEHIVVSFETRREWGEKFSPLLGMLRQFEIIYVVGSEQDMVGVRTDIRKERVYLYPTKATQEQALHLFEKIVEDINAVYAKPRIYNTLTHNCTNELYRRVEDISDTRFPLTWKTILPGYFDEVLYTMGIIDTSDDFLKVKEAHRVDNTRVNRHDIDFEASLRSHIPQITK